MYLGSPSVSGAMNSWFYHDFVVYSMGSISAKIAYYLGKFDYNVGHGVGEWYNHAVPMNTMGRSSVLLRPSLSYDVVWCVCFFC
jgi:hypothetical protein